MTMSPQPVSERILQHLKARFEAVTDLGGEPGLTWETIIRAPIKDENRKLKSVLSIMQGHERTGAMSMTEEKFLDVSFEFEVKAYAGEDAGTFVNQLIAEIQKTLAVDRQCGGLCLHVRVTGSDCDIESEGDRRVGGIVFATIHYRHRDGDPCRLLGE